MLILAEKAIITTMRLILGTSTRDITRLELAELAQKFNTVHIDIGTGDGRFVFKNAIRHQDGLFIGVDPSQAQLEKYSKKALKTKVTNCLFVLGSIELLPEELFGLATKVTVILPWGSLLSSIALPNSEAPKKLYDLLKESGELEILFGYAHETEPSEVDRLGLENLSLEYVKANVVPNFLNVGFQGVTISPLQKETLKNFDSTWSKKLSFGQERPLFHLKLTKTSPVGLLSD